MAQLAQRGDSQPMPAAGDRLPADRLTQVPNPCGIAGRVSRVWYQGGVVLVCGRHGLVGSATTAAELFALRCKVG